MTLKDFAESVNSFAADTAAWGGLDPYKHYVAIENGGWVETCDNQEGGIDISWAFGLPTGKINPAIVKEEYEEKYNDLLRLAEDDEWDAEQRRSLYRKFEDLIVNREGTVFCDQWEAIKNMMDPEIVSTLDAETEQELFSAYEAAHEQIHGSPWELSKKNPTW